MNTVSAQLESLRAAEPRLAENVPFGSYDYISDRLLDVYIRLLSVVTRESAGARVLLESFDAVDARARKAVLRDALTRRTIEDGVCKCVQGIDTIESALLDQLLMAAARNATTATRSLLNGSVRCVPLHEGRNYGYVWLDAEAQTLPGQRFIGEVLTRLPGLRVEPPTSIQLEHLIEGASLAEHIAPDLARSALSHIFIVIVGAFQSEQQYKSLTTPGLPGVVFLAPDTLTTSSDAAEALFHEALHLKFLDIDYVHPLFAPGFRQETSHRISPIWHRDKPEYGNWPIDRVLTSMHVYLSLAVFFSRATEAGFTDFDPERCASRARQCHERALWLYESAQPHLDCLSTSGSEFVAALGTLSAQTAD